METEVRKDVNSWTKREPCDIRTAHRFNLEWWRGLSARLGTLSEGETTQY